MKKLDVANLDISGKVETLEHIFDNMHAKHDGLSQAGYLLGGDTGVGKTSFVKDMATLLGLELIIIETPHIVEEHIIDIPFIVVKPSGASKTEHLHIDTKGGSEYDIELAKSALYSEVKEASKATDSGVIKAVMARGDLKQIWEELGGSDKAIPDEIKDIRSKYRAILFLDEYFRQTSSSIRNMLRSILNGRIGSNPLPDDLYVIFASNLVDSGVGDILENEDFRMLNFDTPSTDEWFAYIINKYKNNKKVQLNEKLLQKFYDLMTKEEHKGILSHDDINADVRVSPRRWEQLLIYINSAFPLKSKEDADALLKNVQINFQNYKTGDKAAISEAVIKAVNELIKEDHGFEGNPDNVDDADWRSTLKHQIETKMKLGNARKYIPVIGGLPGAGKTKHITDLATDLNLVPVFIDVQNLSAEEVIGVPLSKRGKDGLQVSFSKPPLWDDIQKQMKTGEANLKERLVKFFGKEKGDARFAAWKGQDVHYLIFFDEMNRTNVKVFNAIRKVLLEKEFTPEYKLPDDSVVVAAVNPTGKGTQELTKHVRDVMDVIPVGVSWDKFKKHLSTVDLKVSPEASQISHNVLYALVDRFRTRSGKVNGADPHFVLNIADTGLYVSAREYTDMLTNMAKSVDRTYKRESKKLEDPEHDVTESEAAIRTAISRAVQHTLEYVIKHKHGVDSPESIESINDWIMSTDDFTLGELFKRKVDSLKDLKSLLQRPFDDHSKHLLNDLEFVNYITSVDSVQFKEELSEFLMDAVKNDAKNAFQAFGKTKNMDKKTLAIKVQDEEIAKLEYIMREVVHAMKAHDVSNKMVDAAKAALREVVIHLASADADIITDVVDFNGKMRKYVTELFK
jgi:MoxR-like ATPase